MSLCRQFLRGHKLLSQCQRLSALTQQKCYDSTSSGGLKLTFASPADVYYNEEGVNQVDVPTLTGVFGVLAGHVPTIAALQPGVVTVYKTDGTDKIFVSSGTVTVNNDSSMQILAEEAHPLDRFDAKNISEVLKEYDTLYSRTEAAEEKAELQVAIDCLRELSQSV